MTSYGTSTSNPVTLVRTVTVLYFCLDISPTKKYCDSSNVRYAGRIHFWRFNVMPFIIFTVRESEQLHVHLLQFCSSYTVVKKLLSKSLRNEGLRRTEQKWEETELQRV
jgi:hypothetical protein